MATGWIASREWETEQPQTMLQETPAALRYRAGPTTGTPKIAVVIVNYCQWKNTARLTELLHESEVVRQGSAEIVIVDNDSPDDRAARSLCRFSHVSIEHSARNIGFAKAVNHGAMIHKSDWLLLLNPDVTVPKGFLDSVLEAGDALAALDSKTGVIGLQLRNPDGTKQASSGPFPTLFRTLFGLLSPRSRRKCQHQDLQTRQRVPWVTGGCLLVRRECFEQLNGLDESFFLYYEDVDFCQRATHHGWSIWYEPELRAVHHFPLHTRHVPAPLRLITRHALLTYAQKHWGKSQQWLLRKVIALEAIARRTAARCRNESVPAGCYENLQLLVDDIRHNRDVSARLRYAAAFLHETASSNDGKTEPQELMK